MFFICWLCNKLKKILLFSFEKNSVVSGIRTHAHKSETKWRWENLFSPKKYFQMQFFLILRIAIHTPPIQNERSYPNLFKKAGPKYLLVPALYEIFIWKQPFYYINFPENDFCVGTHWLQTPILNSFGGRNLQIFTFCHLGNFDLKKENGHQNFFLW